MRRTLTSSGTQDASRDNLKHNSLSGLWLLTCLQQHVLLHQVAAIDKSPSAGESQEDQHARHETAAAPHEGPGEGLQGQRAPSWRLWVRWRWLWVSSLFGIACMRAHQGLLMQIVWLVMASLPACIRPGLAFLPCLIAMAWACSEQQCAGVAAFSRGNHAEAFPVELRLIGVFMP